LVSGGIKGGVPSLVSGGIRRGVPSLVSGGIKGGVPSLVSGGIKGGVTGRDRTYAIIHHLHVCGFITALNRK